MGKRGSANFRRTDGIRALRMAKDAGLDPAAIEVVVAPDGTVTFRVLGEKAPSAGASSKTTAAEREWQDEIAKLKATPKKGR
jgi:hypothetical protein